MAQNLFFFFLVGRGHPKIREKDLQKNQNMLQISNSYSSRYPSDKVLLNSYRQKADWDAYKNHVTDHVMQPLMVQARRRRPLVGLIDNMQATKRRQDNRLLSTLRRNKAIGDKEERESRARRAEEMLQGLREQEERGQRGGGSHRGTPRPQLHVLTPGGVRRNSVVARSRSGRTTSESKSERSENRNS